MTKYIHIRLYRWVKYRHGTWRQKGRTDPLLVTEGEIFRSQMRVREVGMPKSGYFYTASSGNPSITNEIFTVAQVRAIKKSQTKRAKRAAKAVGIR